MRLKDTLGISHLIKKLEHELSLKLSAALEPLGMTLPQYVVLSCLEEKPHATNADLARKASVTPQTMNRILQILEREKFVTRRPDPEHGLKQGFALTPKAEKAVCSAHERVNEVELAMVRGLSKKGLAEFQEAIRECGQGLEQLED